MQCVLEFPLVVTVPAQTRPVLVTVRAQLTTSDLILSPKLLDFGSYPVSEAVGLPLTLHNPSHLPQSFSFGPKLPLGLRLSPNYGYGRLAWLIF